MERVRRVGRDVVIGLLGTVALVTLVRGPWFVGVALGVLACWQLAAAARGRPVLFVDQREADREGKPNLR